MATVRRSPEEIAKSMEAAKKIKAQQVLNEQRNRIKYAKIALLVIGIIQIVFAVTMYFVWHWPIINLIIDGIIGVIFIVLYFVSQEKPKLAFNFGLVIYTAIQVIFIVVDEENLVNGFLIKMIIFATLFGGLAALKRIPESLMNKKEDDDILDTKLNNKDLI